MDDDEAAERADPSRLRRHLLGRLGGGALLAASSGVPSARAEEPAAPSWREAGTGFSNYGVPPPDGEAIRWITADPSSPGGGASWTPLHALEGTITPNGLHFERHHGGVPRLQERRWEMRVSGLVERELALDLEALRRRPQRSRLAFIECGGNSNALWREPPVQAPAGWLHGLVSSGEWSGVPLRALLEEAGVQRRARWLIATGLDASGVTVSLPLESMPPDTLVALHRNGESLRPEHGWPARLLVPGHEGICNVKWLGRLELADRAAMSRFDTVAYTDLGPDGRALRFSRVMGVKSLVTHPAVGDTVGAGPLAISGLAWSGAGRVERVELSVDGGRSWRVARLDGAAPDRAFVRFRAEWQRPAGREAIVQSRARDEAGRVQPTRAALLEARGRNGYYHYDAILSLAIGADGRVRHVHA